MRIIAEGRIVADVDVAGQYPEAVIQTSEYVAWNSDGRLRQGPLCAFRCDGALVTSAFTVVDPKAGRLFLNQSYSNVTSWFPLRPNVDGRRFFYDWSDVVEVPGRHVVIGGPIDGVWYHWLLNWAPRIALLEKLKPALFHDPTIKFLLDVKASVEPFRSFLEVFGIPEDRLTFIDHQGEHVLEEAHLVSFLDQERYYPSILKEMAMLARPTPKRSLFSRRRRRRVFVSRQGFNTPKRRVANWDDILPVLDRHGVEPVAVEALGARGQVEMFADAELVVGVHGAGLANMVFSDPDCRVLILENARNAEVGLARMFTTLAAVFDLQHEMMICDEVLVEGADYGDFGTLHNRDVVVDPVELDRRLTRLTAR